MEFPCESGSVMSENEIVSGMMRLGEMNAIHLWYNNKYEKVIQKF